MGYLDPNPTSDVPPKPWQDNNYAEFYAKQNSKHVVIMASAGAGNSLWPRFLAYAFQNYNDIDEVFVQSTYWGRFAIAMNPNLDAHNILPIVIEKEKSDELVERYSLGLYSRCLLNIILNLDHTIMMNCPITLYRLLQSPMLGVERIQRMYYSTFI